MSRAAGPTATLLNLFEDYGIEIKGLEADRDTLMSRVSELEAQMAQLSRATSAGRSEVGESYSYDRERIEGDVDMVNVSVRGKQTHYFPSTHSRPRCLGLNMYRLKSDLWRISS